MTMTIVFNLLALSGYQGQEVYIENVLLELMAKTKETPNKWKIIVVTNPQLKLVNFQKFLNAEIIKLPNCFPYNRRFINYSLGQLFFPYLFKKTPIDIVFSPTPLFPILYGKRNIVTIHDCAFRRFSNEGKSLGRLWLHLFTIAAKIIAHKIVTVSKFAKKELEQLYQIKPQKIEVIYGATPKLPQVSQDFIKKVKNKYTKGTPFFLNIGASKPRKNLPRLLESFKIFSKKNPEFKLILAGKIDKRFINIAEEIKKLGLNRSVIQTDFISNKVKSALYQGAEALIFPSLYEGFGLPILEAQSCGIPIAASNIPAFREIAGKGALFFDPNNTEELALSLKLLASNKKLRQRLIAEGFKNLSRFSWKTSIKKLKNIFQEISLK